MTINGAVHVGTAATPASLTVQNSFAFAAPGTAFEFAGKGDVVTFGGAATITNAGRSSSTRVRRPGSATQGPPPTRWRSTARAPSTSAGRWSWAPGRTLNVPVHVANGGSISFNGTASLGAGAGLTMDAGALALITEDLTTDQFTAFANQTSKAAGATVQYQGIVSNTGKTIDLTAGGAAARITASGRVTGGTLANSGAKTALQFGDLTGVTLARRLRRRRAAQRRPHDPQRPDRPGRGRIRRNPGPDIHPDQPDDQGSDGREHLDHPVQHDHPGIRHLRRGAPHTWRRPPS